MDKLKKGVKGIVDGVSKMELDDAKRKGKRFRDNLVKQMNVDLLSQTKAGLLVTEQLDLALSECKAKVESIIKRCHETNRKYRDIEFDLEKDQEQCRYGLPEDMEELQSRPRSNVAVKRVTEIFENPVFFGPDGPNASAVRQGQLGDCWFLAALSAIATVDSGALLKKLCVTRDEEVGVYGFIFFRDCYWESVIVDDLLFWSMPKFDELKAEEKRLYHNDRESYHRVVEKSGEGLEYARSGTVGETWVPLIEKAYAKLHGDYASLEGGFLADAIEDLTGGVATSFQTSDLLSKDKFWHQELQHNELHTRLFGVSLDLDETHSQRTDLDVQGLLPGHAYSVMRVRECRGKRFVIVRNPWGDSEWTGAWGDGSKEWKGEWLDALQELKHEFGNDGQFVMEYKDFMTVFSQIDRATIFDPSWSMSWHFMPIPPQPLSRLWIYGDAEFNISIDRSSSAVVVLSQMDDRYYKNLQGTEWNLDFVIFQKGEYDPSKAIAASGISLGSRRSVSCELTLDAGEYVVLPRVEAAYSFITRKRARVLNDLAMAWSKVLPAHPQDANEKADIEGMPPIPELPSFFSSGLDNLEIASDDDDESDNEGDDKPGEKGNKDKADNFADDGEEDAVPMLTPPLFLGLRVYTQNKAVADVTGKLSAWLS